VRLGHAAATAPEDAAAEALRAMPARAARRQRKRLSSAALGQGWCRALNVSSAVNVIPASTDLPCVMRMLCRISSSTW